MFIFNGERKNFLKSLQGRSRIVIPQRQINTMNVPHMNGSIDVSDKFEAIEIVQPVGFEATEEQFESYKDELVRWLYSQDYCDLEFSDSPGRVYKVKVNQSLNFTRFGDLYEGSLFFYSPSPFLYGETQSITNLEAIDNQGTANAMPIFNVYFRNNLTNFHIAKGEKNFRLIREFTAGDRVIIDCEKQLVQHNDNLAMPIRDWRTPFKWLTLTPGENEFVADDGADVEITFKERYL